MWGRACSRHTVKFDGHHLLPEHVYTHVCAHVYTHVYTHVRTHVYIHMSLHICLYTYVFTHTSLHTCLYTHVFTYMSLHTCLRTTCKGRCLYTHVLGLPVKVDDRLRRLFVDGRGEARGIVKLECACIDLGPRLGVCLPHMCVCRHARRHA